MNATNRLLFFLSLIALNVAQPFDWSPVSFTSDNLAWIAANENDGTFITFDAQENIIYRTADCGASWQQLQYDSSVQLLANASSYMKYFPDLGMYFGLQMNDPGVTTAIVSSSDGIHWDVSLNADDFPPTASHLFPTFVSNGTGLFAWFGGYPDYLYQTGTLFYAPQGKNWRVLSTSLNFTSGFYVTDNQIAIGVSSVVLRFRPFEKDYTQFYLSTNGGLSWEVSGPPNTVCGQSEYVFFEQNGLIIAVGVDCVFYIEKSNILTGNWNYAASPSSWNPYASWTLGGYLGFMEPQNLQYFFTKDGITFSSGSPNFQGTINDIDSIDSKCVLGVGQAGTVIRGTLVG